MTGSEKAATAGINEIKQELGIVPTSERPEFFNMLIYGDYGHGKTHFCATADDSPLTSPVLFLDVEGGMATIEKFPRWADSIEHKEVRTLKQLVELHDKLSGPLAGVYKTVVIDSITELQRLDMSAILKAGVAPGQDPEVASPREYGKSLTHMRAIVRAYKDLPMHCIFTALLSEEQEADNTMTFGPNLTGKARREIPGFVDVVGWISVDLNRGSSERRLQVTPTRRVKAKDRLGIIAPGKEGTPIINPTVPMLLEMAASNRG